MISPQYMAGMLDADGCFMIPRRPARLRTSPTYLIEVRLTNTDEPMMLQVQKEYGGLLYGKELPNPLHKKRYDLRWVSLKAENLLVEIYPYLIIKKQQADLLLKLLAITSSHKTNKLSEYDISLREKLFQEVRRLNGVEIST